MLRNTNELLGKMGIDGVKTGQSARAGKCLILYANRDPQVVRQGQMETVYQRHLMVVLLGSSNRFGEAQACYSVAGNSTINGLPPVGWPIQKNCSDFVIAN